MNSQYTLNYRVMSYDTDAMAKEGRHLVLVSHEVHYHSPAFLADTVLVNTCLEKVEKSSMYVKTEIRRAENDKLCVSVRQRIALVQMTQGRPCRMPAEWMSLAAPQEES